MIVEWSGLEGRELAHLEGRRMIFGGHASHQNVFRNTLSVRADQISDGLPELVGQLVTPLYELFDFFRTPGVADNGRIDPDAFQSVLSARLGQLLEAVILGKQEVDVATDQIAEKACLVRLHGHTRLQIGSMANTATFGR